MLPKPFIKYIPSFFDRDLKLIALSNKIDSNLNEWKKDVLDLNTIIDPVQTNRILLNDIGQYLNAGILNTDTEKTKRQKIRNAIATHKKRSTWIFDVKPTIDSMIGGDSQLFGGFADNSDFIILGQEIDDPNYYWGTLGIDGIDDNLGVDIVGDGNETVLAGIFLIDVGGGVTTDIVPLKIALEDKISDYFRVFLGYTINDDFYKYPNGQIN